MSLFSSIGTFAAAALPVAASVFSGGNPAVMAGASAISSALGQMQTNSQNSANAAAQEAFQLNTQNTGYQRAMASMQAAGLNPILAYQNGPFSGLQGNIPSYTSPIGVAASSANNALQQYTALENTVLQQDQINAAIANTNQNTANSAQDFEKKHLEAKTAHDTGEVYDYSKGWFLRGLFGYQAAVNSGVGANTAKSITDLGDPSTAFMGLYNHMTQ